MSAYIHPTFGPDERIGPEDCFARAQRAIEVAEINLDGLIEATGGRLTTAEAIAHADARASIGVSWVALGAAMRGAR